MPNKKRKDLRRQHVPGKDAQDQRPRFVPDKERQGRWLGFVLVASAVDGGVAATVAVATAGWTCMAKQLGLHVQKQPGPQWVRGCVQSGQLYH
jgi:IS30 family transposase